MHQIIYAAYFALGVIGFLIFLQLALRIVWRRKARFAPAIWFLCLSLLIYAVIERGINGSLSLRLAERVELASNTPDTVRIAGVWPDDQPRFFSGLRRAVEEVNAAGGVSVYNGSHELKRVKMELVEFPESEMGGPRYKEIAQDSSIMAVIGHRFVEEAVPASVSYDESGLLYLVPTITSAVLTSHKFRTVIQLLPNDSKIVAAMASFLAGRNYRRIAVLAPRTDEAQTINQYFMRAMERLQTGADKGSIPQVTYFRSYSIKQQRMEELVADLLARQPDAIVILDPQYSFIPVIRNIRDRNTDIPILGLPQMETSRFFTELANHTQHIYVPSLLPRLDADQPTIDPTAHLVDEQAYESVKLLAAAWQRARTVDPTAVAGVFRAYPDWKGRYGTYDFRGDGSMQGRGVQMKTPKGNLFVPIEPYEEQAGEVK